MKKIYFLLFAFLIAIFSWEISAQNIVNELREKTLWKTSNEKNTKFPEGLAGVFFGKVGEKFIWVGGSHFPEGKPWEGGKKHFSNQIFVFDFQKDKSVQLKTKSFLKEGVAEGAFAVTPKGLICIGGQTENGVSNRVFLVSWNEVSKKINIENLPNLPVPVKSASAAVIGSKVYLVGGQLANGFSSNQFLEFDVNDSSKGWKALQNFPISVSGNGLVAQQDGHEVALYSFGGRALTSEKITQFYSDVYAFKPSQNKWIKKKNIQSFKKDYPLAVAAVTKEGATSVVLIGGDTGKIFNQIEKAINQNDIALRDNLWKNHSGFNKQVLVYNTITDEWFNAGKIQNPVAVGAAFSEGGANYIVGGEQKPGIRSPYISEVSFYKEAHFGWVNYAVLVVYFVGMLFIGFLFMKNNNNTDDYFKGGGRIPWWASGISIFATMLSAITFLSIPAKTYATDWRMLFFSMTILMAVPFIIRYFLPFFLRFNFETAYQYLEVRFNRPVRWIASALFVFFMISRIAIVLYLPSIALNAVTGFNVYYAVLLMSIVTIIYSSSGGMEAVVWGDVIQGFILIGGALVAFGVMIFGVEGGVSEFINTTFEFQKFKIFDFHFDFTQPTFWVVILGGFANTLISYTSDQSVIQRYMTTVDEKTTAKSIWLNGLISAPVSMLFFLLGTGLFAFYKSNPKLMEISNPNIDSIFPQFIVSEMPMGLAGLLIAAIFAAAMSTLSSNINSVSAVVTSDFYRTIFKNTSFKSDMNVARWSGVIVGLLGTAMALVLATWNVASLWDQFNTFLGLLTSGLGALFILGIFFPRVNAISAIIGLFGGIIILYIIKENTPLSFLLFGLIGMISSILISVICSFILPNKKDIKGLTWQSKDTKL